MADIHELITEALHGLPVEAPIGSLNGRDTRKIADVLVEELGLREEFDADFTGGERVRYVTNYLT